MTAADAVLVDTDVYSRVYIRRRRADSVGGHLWDRLAGMRILISFQTRAEVLTGALQDGWGERRMVELRQRLEQTPTVGIDEAVIEAYATLTAACRTSGHALHQKVHAVDRWIAACAIAKRLPMLSGDAIFAGAPSLRLLSE